MRQDLPLRIVIQIFYKHIYRTATALEIYYQVVYRKASIPDTLGLRCLSPETSFWNFYLKKKIHKTDSSWEISTKSLKSGVGGSPLVAPAKQSVVLGWVLAADASCSGLQLPEWLEGDTKALGPHGRSPGLQILIPETRSKNTCASAPEGWAVGTAGWAKGCIEGLRTHLAVVFLIQSSQAISPQKGICTIWSERERQLVCNPSIYTKSTYEPNRSDGLPGVLNPCKPAAAYSAQKELHVVHTYPRTPQ